MYQVWFMGKLDTRGTQEYFMKETANKRKKAYDLVPGGATIITKELIGLCQGWLMGGVLSDSVRKVYGICSGGGLPGYSCSIYWVPTEKELKEITPDINQMHGEFFKKGDFDE